MSRSASPTVALLLAVAIAGCAALQTPPEATKPAPVPPAWGKLPPVVERVALVIRPGEQVLQVQGADVGDAAADGALYGLANSALLLPGCLEPISCIVVGVVATVSTATLAVVGATQGEWDASESAAQLVNRLAAGAFEERLIDRIVDRLNSGGIAAGRLSEPPSDESVPAGYDALLTLGALEMRTEAKEAKAERGFAFSVKVGRRLRSLPDVSVTETYRYHAEPRLIRQWLAEDARPVLDAYAVFAEGVAERVVDSFGEAWIDSLVTPRDGLPAGTSPLKSVFVGLRPIDPPLSTDYVDASIFTRGRVWARVASLTPLLRWEPFPEAASQVTYELRVAKARSDGLAPGDPVYHRMDLVAPEHRLESPLEPGSKYFWSVRPHFLLDGRRLTGTWGQLYRAGGIHRASGYPLSERSYRFRTAE